MICEVEVDGKLDGKFIWRVPVDLKFIEKIGSGAYGSVASFEDKRTKRMVAVKKISSAFNNPVDGKRSVREVKLLRQLHHPNIIQVLDILPPEKPDFEDIYIVTDLMKTDLGRVMYSKQRLTEEHHQCFIHDALRGLAYLHSASIVHRDIKPANLLVNADCKLKICDFGLARVLSKEMGEVNLTVYVGTRMYRAPEVIASKHYTTAVDVWAVVCILYELINRKPLFAGRDHLDHLCQIVKTLGPGDAELQWLEDSATKFLSHCQRSERIDWNRALPQASLHAIEVVSELLKFDPMSRITAAGALNLEFFEPLFDKANVEQDTSKTRVEWNFDDNFEPTTEVLRSLVYSEMATLHPDIELPADRCVDKVDV